MPKSPSRPQARPAPKRQHSIKTGSGGYAGRIVNQLERLRDKWARGETCLGINVTLTDSTVVELFGEAGFDIVWIDMEHSSMGLEHAVSHVRACRAAGMAPFIRVPSNDPVVVKPFLEMHPAGVIMPRIGSVEDAELAVQGCRYPPHGIRGFGPNRGVRFGARSVPDYLAAVDDEILTILQIEHIDAVERIDEILQIPGVDSIVPGPMDLSGTMGLLGQTGHPDVVAAMQRMLDAARARGVPMGQSIGPDGLRHWIDAGVNWICSGGDWHLLYPAARTLYKTMSSMT